LVQAVLKEKQLRQRIEELKEFKKKGFRNLAEIEAELEGKKKKDEKMKKKEPEYTANDKVTSTL
jgi:transcriptional adapter 2-alpha